MTDIVQAESVVPSLECTKEFEKKEKINRQLADLLSENFIAWY